MWKVKEVDNSRSPGKKIRLWQTQVPGDVVQTSHLVSAAARRIKKVSSFLPGHHN